MRRAAGSVTELHFSQERMLRIAFMTGSGTRSAPSNLTYRFSEVEILDLSLVTSQIPTLLPVAPLMVETFLYDERSRVCELGLDDVYIYFTATALDVTIGPMGR